MVNFDPGMWLFSRIPVLNVSLHILRFQITYHSCAYSQDLMNLHLYIIPYIEKEFAKGRKVL